MPHHFNRLTRRQCQELSDYYGIPSIETSALTGHNVAVAITALTLDMINGGVVSKSPSIKSLSVVGFNNSKENVTIYDISVKTKVVQFRHFFLKRLKPSNILTFTDLHKTFLCVAKAVQ